MRTLLLRRLLLRTLLLLLALISTTAAASTPLAVFVSIPPQEDFVERVGGDLVHVESLVKQGFSPHSYEPTPGQMTRLAAADLYLGIGLPVEAAWMKRIRAVNPDITFLDLSSGLSRRPFDWSPVSARADHRAYQGEAAEKSAAAEEHHHDESELDPHLWTSPQMVKKMGVGIAESLGQLAPAHKADFAANLATFQADLDGLDRDIRRILAGLKHRRFMIFHPSWGYFADTYGLEQIPIEHEGKEPGPRSLAELIERAKRDDIRIVFAQPQFSRKAAEKVAQAIGGRVVLADNLAPNYFDNLRHFARSLAETENPATPNPATP
ncbi:zinc ABC transporter solute-binding protein [Thiorhodococcus mannitoliphagus]|uniref:High-affinity zinc uptake system protein ZnuA n=1 Tax=Thiorhodococcus mannitoliphagus TaxID=329406 RepID=A0A6P1DPD9_9GAMM|nr:zinc ABC transporter substrate-binding protein [Thiorhodococcus mannitoliphagus]NEX19430.1 zinc ABC transporter solute-binding protein [Thiorhodococcus mannitoliphagus]